MKKLLIFLYLLLINCSTLNEVYLLCASPILHAKNLVALRNDPPCFNYSSVQSAINSDIKACICIKINQYKSSSYKNNSTRYPSYYSSQAINYQSNLANIPFGVNGAASTGAAVIQSAPDFSATQEFYFIDGCKSYR
jgi:hypothetical protein